MAAERRAGGTAGSARKAARNLDDEAESEATAAAIAAAAAAAAPAGVAEPESEGGNSVLSLAVAHNSGADLVRHRPAPAADRAHSPTAGRQARNSCRLELRWRLTAEHRLHLGLARIAGQVQASDRDSAM